MKDNYSRNINYMRISITDLCNFRCKYCMPEQGIKQFSNEEILTFEEIEKIVEAAVRLGITRFKITGGEPLIRRGFIQLLRKIKAISGVEKLTLTTNGYFLKEYLPDLKQIDIDGINISLDTLKPERFFDITRRNGLEKVLEGLQEAVELGIPSLKVNCVPMSSNLDEIADIAKLAEKWPVHVRFIEMMPIGLGKENKPIYQEDVRKILDQVYGRLSACDETLGNGPANYYRLSGFQGKIGFISAMSHEFCGQCNRIRLTADGTLKLCLNDSSKFNLRDCLRNAASDGELHEYMANAIKNKPGRHGFLEKDAQHELRQMVRIGG